MSTRTLILLVVATSVIMVSVTTVFLLRLYVRKFGIEEMVDEGVVLTESGIEFSRFIIFGKRRVNYADIESVEFIPFPNSLFLSLRYGTSVQGHLPGRWNLFLGTVVVKLKPSYFIRHHLFKPSNPAEFADELRSRINKCVY